MREYKIDEKISVIINTDKNIEQLSERNRINKLKRQNRVREEQKISNILTNFAQALYLVNIF